MSEPIQRAAGPPGLRVGWSTLVLAALALAGLGRPARAQDSLVVIRPIVTGADTMAAGAPSPEVVRRVIRAFNDSLASRFVGSFLLPAGSRHIGQMAVYRGNLRVYGRIDGDVTVINGDLIVASGGLVSGDVLVVGGRIEVRPGGIIVGRREEHEGLAPVVRGVNGLLAEREARKPLGELAAARTTFQAAGIKTTLNLETGKTYNRVEGLPIVFGPTFTTQATVDAKVDVRGIFRPATDRTKLRDDIGFVVSTEFSGGGRARWLTFGGRGYRQIVPIEDQPLARGEAGWSAFLLQRDYRDHYEARGIEGFASARPAKGVALGFSFRGDLERSVPASDPISIFRNSDTWRPNPLIDDGHYRTARFTLDLDSRNDQRRPAAGWLIHAQLEHSTSSDASPVALPPEVRSPLPPGGLAFSKLWFDARRYARFNPTSLASLRVVGGGWIGGDPLPVQRRVSLGGPDILPGFGFRDLNCGPAGFVDQARASLCDRMLAVQLEVRTNFPVKLPFRLVPPDVAVLQQVLGIEQAELVIFGDAGKAWLTGAGPGRVPNNRIPVLGEWDADAGFGIDTGGLGLYVAKALTADQPIRFIIRLQQRF